MNESPTPAAEAVRPLIRVRQIRDFTTQAVADAEVDAIVDAARWSGSASNEQPWRFIVIRRAETIRGLAESYMPSARPLQTAAAAIAIAVPDDPDKAVSRSFDEGRAAERLLIAASLLGLAAAVTWVWPQAQDAVKQMLGVPDGWHVRTIAAIGHPSEAGLKPKSAPGAGRKPREEIVFAERWSQR